MGPAPGQSEPLKKMAKIVNTLYGRNDAVPFIEPVDWRGLELYDYPKIIKKMMDLGTIKRRIERGNYNTAHQVAEDVRLVWSNCMTYNVDGSDFWLLAKSFSRRFEDRYRKVKAEFDVGEDLFDEEEETEKPKAALSKSSSSRSLGVTKESAAFETASSSSYSGNPSLDARAKFGSNLFSLSGPELGHVMTTLEIECPNVLESWGEEKVEIDVDEIPSKVFASLNSYVSTKVGSRSLLDSTGMEEIPKKKKRKTM